MIDSILAVDIERFRALIVNRLGLSFDEGKSGVLGEVLKRRLDAPGLEAATYLSRLEARAVQYRLE